MPDLSIIIPIYNTPADALLRCFDSIHSLTGFGWEVILVDDGSAAATGQFCREYAEKHPSFRYFYKENGGVSSARNLGLDQAQGTRILFVDADDMLMGAPITADLVQDPADLVVFDVQLSYKGVNTLWSSLPVPPGSVDRQTYLKHLLSGKDLNSPCVKLYRRDLIEAHHLRFRTGFVTGEDWFFVAEFSMLSQSFRYVNKPCYCYFRDDASGNSRLARFPDTMLENHIAMFDKKQQIIGSMDWDDTTLTGVKNAAAMILTEDMFNFAADLLLLKIYTPERKKKIRDAVAQAAALIPSLPMKTRLKAYTVLHFPAGLWLLARLRAIYLKIKR